METANPQKLTKIKKNMSAWLIWSVPLLAVLICAYLYLDYLRKIGPEITISFTDASGVETQKTKLKYRGIDVGVVKSVKISDDAKETLIKVRLNKDVEQFAVQGSKFWVVTPKVSLQGVAGLDSLVQGVYLGVLPGKLDGPKEKNFKGTYLGEMTDSLENTSAYLIEADSVESISEGNAITYRGMNIGTVSKITLSKSGQNIVIQINIDNRYTRLIRTNTRFWRKVGVQADVGLFGADIKVNSLESIMRGGIALATPDDRGSQAKALAKFKLEKEAPKDFEKWNPSLQN